jgi:glycosyltransferase involved in cell wall biosynthesis
MKICMMAHTVYKSDARVRSVVESFAGRGDTVDLICLRDPSEPAHEIAGSVHIYRPVRRRKPSRISLYMLQLAWFLIASTWRTTIYFFKKRYDVIYVHTIPDFLVFAGLLPKWFGARIILDMHEIMPELYMNRHHILGKNLMLSLITWMERISVNFADHIFVAAPFLVEKLHIRYQCRHKITVILNLPNPKYFTLPAQTRQADPRIFNMIYPGTLSELHGVDVALQALKVLKAEADLPIFFHIYGSGPEKERLVAFAENTGLTNVLFHDEVSVEKLGQLLQRMDLGIVTKRSGVFAEDAISTKLLEFAATGLPAVVSRTRGDMIFFNESMFLFVEPGNARILADGIKTLYLDRDRYLAMTANLSKWAEENHWEKQNQLVWSVLDHLVAGRKISEANIGNEPSFQESILNPAKTSID